MAALKDISLVEETRKDAGKIIGEDPELKKHPFLKERVEEFKKRIHLE